MLKSLLDKLCNPPAKGDTELRNQFLDREYDYLIRSSLHTDDVRDRFIQYYLLVVGAAATIIAAVLRMDGSAPVSPQPTVSADSVRAFIVAAWFIAMIGLIMLPIFARLRRIVLESLWGTVLIKAHVMSILTEIKEDGTRPVEQTEPASSPTPPVEGRTPVHGLADSSRLRAALLWDAGSVPKDESYTSASFWLILFFIFLNSAMWAFGLYLWLAYVKTPACASALWWGLATLIAVVTAEVVVYRLLLTHGLRSAMLSGRLKEKWQMAGLDKTIGEIRQPDYRRPTVTALLTGITLLALLVVAYTVMKGATP